MPAADASPAPGFTFAHQVQTRWADFDSLGHANNAIYLTYLEAARLDYLRRVLGTPALHTPWVLADVRCRYVSPLVLEEHVLVSLRVTRVGTSSLSFAYAMHTASDGRLVADGEAVQVHVRADSGRPTPIPSGWREAIQHFEAAHTSHGARAGAP